MIPIIALLKNNNSHTKLDTHTYNIITSNAIIVVGKDMLHRLTYSSNNMEQYVVAIGEYDETDESKYPNVFFTNEIDINTVYVSAHRYFTIKNQGYPVPMVDKLIILDEDIAIKYNQQVMTMLMYNVNDTECNIDKKLFGEHFTTISPFWASETELKCIEVWYQPNCYDDIKETMLSMLYKINRWFHTWKKYETR